MLGGPVGSRRAKRRVVPLPGQSRWLPLRRHQDAPATAGTEASRHRSGRAARAGGGAQAADHLKVGSCGKAAAWCSPRRSAPCSNGTTSGAASGRSPERSACATSEFLGAAAHVREHYFRGRRPSRGDRPVADHQQTRTTESVYRRELRPVITIGAGLGTRSFRLKQEPDRCGWPDLEWSDPCLPCPPSGGRAKGGM